MRSVTIYDTHSSHPQSNTHVHVNCGALKTSLFTFLYYVRNKNRLIWMQILHSIFSLIYLLIVTKSVSIKEQGWEWVRILHYWQFVGPLSLKPENNWGSLIEICPVTGIVMGWIRFSYTKVTRKPPQHPTPPHTNTWDITILSPHDIYLQYLNTYPKFHFCDLHVQVECLRVHLTQTLNVLPKQELSLLHGEQPYKDVLINI